MQNQFKSAFKLPKRPGNRKKKFRSSKLLAASSQTASEGPDGGRPAPRRQQFEENLRLEPASVLEVRFL